MALIIPVAIVVLFSFTEIGLALWTQSVLQSAVEDAARCAAVNANTCGTTAAVQSYAATRTVGIAVPASSFTVTTPACGDQVAVSYPFNSSLPQILPFSVTFTARACHP